MKPIDSAQCLSQSWFMRPTVVVAADLIGKILCRRLTDEEGCVKTLKMRITETEAYIGLDDPACHSHAGTRTKRTETMYQQGGIFYVYLTYGIHHMLNIVTSRQDSPEAVLIRAGFLLADNDILTEDTLAEDTKLNGDKKTSHIKALAGPGKLTKRLNIDRSLNTQKVAIQTGLWIEDDGCLPPVSLRPRIGIDYAGEAKDWLLRFVWIQHPSLSKK